MNTTQYAPAAWHVHQQLGPPTTRCNPGAEGSPPFAIVDFPGRSYFTIDDPAEADRLAAAFTEAARLLRDAEVTIASDESGES